MEVTFTGFLHANEAAAPDTSLTDSLGADPNLG